MSRLKLDPRAVTRLLDELDREEERVGGLRTLGLRHDYRQSAVHVEIERTRDVTSIFLAPTRNIGSDGVAFLTGQLIHVNTLCRIHLITIRSGTQVVTGHVQNCRYVSGTPGVHEVNLRFDDPIDPASFATSAVRPRVLVVDDSEMARRLLSHMLARHKAEIDTARNGLEAVAAAQADDYDLILMDIEMPELDGISATRALRGRGYVRPIAAISANTGEEVRAQCRLAGCDAFVMKPPDPVAIEGVVSASKPAPIVSSMLHCREMQPLIDAFVFDLPARVRRIESAFASDETSRLVQELRQLKGEAGGFGFEPITEQAAALEIEFGQDQLPDPRRALGELVRMCMAARPATFHVRTRQRRETTAVDSGRSAGGRATDAPVTLPLGCEEA